MQIHCAISKIDVEKDIQALIEKTAISSAENKSEFLLTDYFVSMGWKEVSLMWNLSQRRRDSFWKKLRAIVKETFCFVHEKTDVFIVHLNFKTVVYKLGNENMSLVFLAREESQTGFSTESSRSVNNHCIILVICGFLTIYLQT